MPSQNLKICSSDNRSSEMSPLYGVLHAHDYLLFDGAMGTMTQKQGLSSPTNVPDMLCLEQPDSITGIHRQYVNAGAQAVTTNTFSANRLKLEGIAPVQDVVSAALACARASNPEFVALSIGPLGSFLEPVGDISVDEAEDMFAEQVCAALASKNPPDIILIETMMDIAEAKAALTAAKRHAHIPVFVTMTFDARGYTLMGATPELAARELEHAGADAVGINCSVGPEDIAQLIHQMRAVTDLPLICQPNAGLPTAVDGRTVYSLDVEEYISAYADIIEADATILGSCCGTTPAYTEALRASVDEARRVKK